MVKNIYFVRIRKRNSGTFVIESEKYFFRSMKANQWINRRGGDLFRVVGVALLVSLIGFTFLVRPLHLIVSPHMEGLQIDSHEKTVLTALSKVHTCPICNFEFCTFVPTIRQVLSSFHFDYCKELVYARPTWIYFGDYSFAPLRAPPIC